ncbi:hypothetical protein [Vibrio alginolyticus]|uniref:hypothetical protein n=1 Tax=Vibrio alginolyticus TaxID=663 RepID=UPI003D7DC317
MNPRVVVNEKHWFEINAHADMCPHCHYSVKPTNITSSLSGNPDKSGAKLELVYRCTRNECSRLFISSYIRTTMQGTSRVGVFKYQNSSPVTVKNEQFQDEINQVSPSFCEIFNQASAAEQYGLHEIAGVAYRKSLEFLIKDYCIYKNNDSADNIRSLQLAKVIGQYVSDTNIKECAKRATWLGNDETHYVRKWGDKDLSDLKILIRLTLGWVLNCILTEKYLSEMT